MRLVKLALLVTWALLPVARPAAQAADLDKAPRLSFEDFKKGLDSGAWLVIDVRAREAYRNGHIPGAASVPLGEVAARAAELRAAGKPIVAYCA